MSRAQEIADLLAGVTITTADNTAQLILKSTDADASTGPLLQLHRDSSSPADDDAMGTIDFRGENSASEVINYVRINTRSADVTDGTEDAKFDVNTLVAGASVNRFSMTPTETVFNEDSVDVDFRVEGNGDANLLYVDAGNDRIGIGTASPAHNLDVTQTGSTSVRVGATGSSGDNDGTLIINNGGSGDAMLRFDYEGNTDRARIGVSSSAQQLEFYNAGAEGMRLIAAPSDKGTLCIGRTTNIGGSRLVVDADGDNENPISVVQQHAGSSSEYLLLFYRGNDSDGYALTGHIQNTNNATAYNTSSDYRLKTNVSYDWDATSRLKQLKPARFDWISDGDDAVTVDGFLAHEVSSVIPEAVSGTKDAMTDAVLYVDGDEIPDGKNVGDVKTEPQIKPQGIDQSKLVPLLCKTILELEARITAIEAS